MDSNVKILGHAVHPILVMFPMGLNLAGTIFDVVAALTGRKDLAKVGFWNVAGGVLGGVPAAAAGYLDWQKIPENTRAKDLGRLHGLTNVLVMALFGASWAIRRADPEKISGAALGLQLAGTAAAGFSGWMGGELVERLGVGVQPGANLNSPNSLTGLPASAVELREQHV